MATTALEGIKVLEYSTDLAAGFCGRLLADVGAEVIKIEPPEGDPSRREATHPEKSPTFLYVNVNKLGVTLNLSSSTGREIFLKLAQATDVLVESTTPGTLEGWELDYDTLSELNPGLIVASITPFGQSGPHAHYKAYPFNAFHAGGEGYVMPSTKTELHRPPLKLGGNVGEYDCGSSAVNATLAALYQREMTGRGQHIDLSKQEALLQMTRTEIDSYPNLNTVETRATRVYPFGGIMPCKDGYEEVIIFQQEQWQTLLQIMGNPGWADDEKFKDTPSRAQNAEELNSHIVEWLKTQTKGDLYHKGQSRDLPFAPLYTISEVLAQPQYKAREALIELDHPEAGKATYPNPPYRFSRTPASLRTTAPCLGEHNQEILCQRLGYSREDLPLLRSSGAI